MSKCISRQGEYSEHEFDAANRFICQRCFVFDEEPALAALEAAEAKVAELLATAPDIPADAAQAAPVLGEEELALDLCDLMRTWEHHDQTDDHPCTRCNGYAAAVFRLLAARLGQRDDQQAADRACWHRYPDGTLCTLSREAHALPGIHPAALASSHTEAVRAVERVQALAERWANVAGPNPRWLNELRAALADTATTTGADT